MKERSFILTGQKFTGSVLFKFSLNGLLILFKVEGILSDTQLKYLYKKIPLHVTQIDQLKDLGEVKIDEVPVDLTFNHFWKEYGNYAGKKKKCEALWESLNDADRSKCLNYLPIYKTQKVKDGTTVAYPETYINNRVWDN